MSLSLVHPCRVVSGSLTLPCTEMHWSERGSTFKQAQQFLIYFSKCFCCMFYFLLHMAINICCFGLYKKSVRKVRQMLLSKWKNNKYRQLSCSESPPDNSKSTWKPQVFCFIVQIYAILSPFKLSLKYIKYQESMCRSPTMSLHTVAF